MRVKHLLVLESTDKPHWYKPSFSSEREEFERVADDFQLPIETLELAYEKAEIRTLDRRMWRDLLNTDSNEERWAFGDEEVADLFLKNNYEKPNLKGIIETIRRNGKLPMPIVIHHGYVDTLVAGNTRLMACAILGVENPKVVYLKVEEK